jgi:hypothetical protein
MSAVGETPDWLRPLMQSIRKDAITPRDQRIKSLWDLLRQRNLLNRDPWLTALLQRIWRQGLAARPRPRTTRRLRQILRALGVLPQRAAVATAVQRLQPVTVRPLRPLVVRRLRTARMATLPRGRVR